MLIDTHFHLDLMENMQSFIYSFLSSDIGIIAVGTTPKAYEREMQFCSEAKNIRVGLGFHPQLVMDRSEEINEFLSLMPKAQYIGEIGLDFNSAYMSTNEKQIECFRAIVNACMEQGHKVLSIHSIKAAGAVIDELETARTFQTCKCIFHWFSGTVSERNRAIENGALFSINPKMLRTKSGQETIKAIPEESILLETDAPFTMKYNSAEELKNELLYMVKAISDLREQDMYGIIEKNSAAVLENRLDPAFFPAHDLCIKR